MYAAAQASPRCSPCLPAWALAQAAPEGFDLSASATKYDGRELSTAFPWLTRRWLMFWQWEVGGHLPWLILLWGDASKHRGQARFVPHLLPCLSGSLPFWAQNQAIGRGHQPVRQAKYEQKGFTLLVGGGAGCRLPGCRAACRCRAEPGTRARQPK